jgi:5-methylthioribose kinase
MCRLQGSVAPELGFPGIAQCPRVTKNLPRGLRGVCGLGVCVLKTPRHGERGFGCGPAALSPLPAVDTMFDLSPQNVPQYLIARGLAKSGDEVCIQEMPGGISNIVLLVQFRSKPGQRWVVKQSLEKLRVEADWRSERERIFREAEAIQMLGSSLSPHTVPEVIDIDRHAYAYVMAAAPAGSEPWKSLLLRGEVDMTIAQNAGDLLAKLTLAGRSVPGLQHRFQNRTVFDQLRIDPYYRFTAMQHPDLRAVYDELIADSWSVRTSLVHGDYSPKNMLVKNGNICLIDFEVVHWGDPAFDAAFLLNHLFLKACHQPVYGRLYFKAAREFWHSLLQGTADECGPQFEQMTVRHLGALLLARIDGNSPVEYIRSPATKERVRQLARRILLQPAGRLEEAIGMAEEQCGISHTA